MVSPSHYRTGLRLRGGSGNLESLLADTTNEPGKNRCVEEPQKEARNDVISAETWPLFRTVHHSFPGIAAISHSACLCVGRSAFNSHKEPTGGMQPFITRPLLFSNKNYNLWLPLAARWQWPCVDPILVQLLVYKS